MIKKTDVSEEFERRAEKMRQTSEGNRLALQIGHDHLRMAGAVGVNGDCYRAPLQG